MSGGVNMIDTAHQFRRQRAERLTGVVLRTLIEKYGFSRDEFFINTKQGFLQEDCFERVPAEL